MGSFSHLELRIELCRFSLINDIYHFVKLNFLQMKFDDNYQIHHQ